MKKLFTLFAAALVMLAAASCEKNEVLPDNNTEGKVITLKATINNGETKTSLGKKGTDGTYPVLWSKGDKIWVGQLYGTSYEFTQENTFTLSGGAGTNNGTFICNDNNAEINNSAIIMALYPSSFNNEEGGIIIPGTQTYVAGSFGKDAMPMGAVSLNATEGLKFDNLLGVLKLQLTGPEGEKVKSIVLTSDKILCGKFSIDFNFPTTIEYPSGPKQVILNCGTDGVALNQTTVTDFHICVPPGTHNFTVVIVTDKGVYGKAATSAKKITAGEILKIDVLDLSNLDSYPNAYVENGVYLGDGVALPDGNGGNIIWAPVNCGYDADHKYGLLYQWGRKYGQGYDGETPSVVKVDGPISSAEDGNNQDNQNKFYKNKENDKDWLSTSNDKLWESPKTQYDPCPNGWRVPTDAEMKSIFNYDYLNNGSSSRDVYITSDNVDNYWTANGGSSNDMPGLYCYGSTTEISGNKIFLPAAGQRKNAEQFQGDYRGTSGFYWTSGAGISLKFYYNSDNRKCTITRSTNSNQNGGRASGFSVRCVKE